MQSKILLVDDREDSLFSMETILEPDGYQFVKASSGRQALKILLNEHDFALILMDVQMPNLNGLETAELIYERDKLRHIPIIFITANHYGEDHIYKGYRAGAVDYIYKPVNPNMLRAKVGVFVDLYRKNYQLLAQEQKLKATNRSLEREIHERKTSEEMVKKLNAELLLNIRMLETANDELDRFAFMASHDLQEPLRKIRTFGDLLSLKFRDLLDEDAKNYISRIQHAAERMQTLIKDILAFSRVSDEKENFIKSDLNLIVQEVLFDLDTTVKEKQALISVEILPSIDVNPGLIRPLFFNLIGNALKYSRKDVSPVIKIKIVQAGNNVTTIPDNVVYCRIAIEDNGIGFDQEYAGQVFDMFKRLHVSKDYEGTGIGLALCKKIVEKHHGFIHAESRPNEGSVFTVMLPVEQKIKLPVV